MKGTKENMKKTLAEAQQFKIKLLYGGSIIIDNYDGLKMIDVKSGLFNKAYNPKETMLRSELMQQLK